MRGIEYLSSQFDLCISPFTVKVGFGKLNETVPLCIKKIAVDIVWVLVDPEIEYGVDGKTNF